MTYTGFKPWEEMSLHAIKLIILSFLCVCMVIDMDYNNYTPAQDYVGYIVVMYIIINFSECVNRAFHD